MPNQGNDRSPTLTWPETDELRSIVRESGKLLESIEGLDWRLRPLYADGAEEHPDYQELGALAWFVSSMQNDLATIGESIASLARVRDVACPTLHL